MSADKILAPHILQTAQRIHSSSARYVLAIQDQMRLNYTHHTAKSDLGTIGKTGKTDQYGIIQHSVLCVDDQNEALGLMDVRFFDYSEFDTTMDRSARVLEKKASSCWIEGLQKMRQRLGHTDKRIITVADREGDFYEFLHPLANHQEEFVIRAYHNRSLNLDAHDQKGKKLKDILEESPIQGTMEVCLQDVNSREIKTMNLSLKAIQITLPIPKKLTEEQRQAKGYEAISLNVVMAYNQEHEWILLTSLPIKIKDQIEEVIQIYRSRWHIEDFHKVLKTGYQVDEIYLHQSKQAIENFLAMACIAACRLYWVIYKGRHEAEIKANQLFEAFEWKAVYVFFKEKVPKEPPSLSEVIIRIARLGGYKPSKNASPPGIKTMWIGYQQFTIAAQMYRNMSTET